MMLQFKIIRSLWCYKYEWWEETSQLDPRGEWMGLEYKAVRCEALIPFWIRGDEKIERYIDRYSDRCWLYV
jgi:hypothetical protein